jgi:hypothetical protein
MGVHCIPSIPGGDAPALHYFCRDKQISHFFFFISMYLLFFVWTRATYSTFMPVSVLQNIAVSEDATFFIVIFYLHTH